MNLDASHRPRHDCLLGRSHDPGRPITRSSECNHLRNHSVRFHASRCTRPKPSSPWQVAPGRPCNVDCLPTGLTVTILKGLTTKTQKIWGLGPYRGIVTLGAYCGTKMPDSGVALVEVASGSSRRGSPDALPLPMSVLGRVETRGIRDSRPCQAVLARGRCQGRWGGRECSDGPRTPVYVDICVDAASGTAVSVAVSD